MKKLAAVIAFVVCIPLIGMLLIKPDKHIWKQKEDDTSVIDESFEIFVREDIGTFYYRPEKLTGLMMYRAIPEDAAFSASEDYIVEADEVYDPEQEYLKALAIVCRSCIVAAWEQEQQPELLDYDTIQIDAGDFYKIIHTDAHTRVLLEDNTLLNDSRQIILNEIGRAVDTTKGAVITREGKVMAAPFFTTTPSGMLVREAGGGVGFSLNYAYELAVSGMDFYEILRYFYDDIRVTIYQ